MIWVSKLLLVVSVLAWPRPDSNKRDGIQGVAKVRRGNQDNDRNRRQCPVFWRYSDSACYKNGNEPRNCGKGSSWSRKRQRCISDETRASCRKNQHWDKHSKSCENSNCSAGQRWSNKKEACVPVQEQTDECGSHQHYDSESGSCTANNCAPSETWSDKSNGCLEIENPGNTCPKGFQITDTASFEFGSGQYYDTQRKGDWKSQEQFCECPSGTFWNDWGMYCQPASTPYYPVEVEIPDCGSNYSWDELLRICAEDR